MRSPLEVSCSEILMAPLQRGACCPPISVVKGDRTMRGWAVWAAALAIVLLGNGIVWLLVATG